MKDRVVNATQFKATCLALLDEMERHGGHVTITKRGRPVAVLGPAKKPFQSPKNSLAGKVRIVGDIVNVDIASLWSVAGED